MSEPATTNQPLPAGNEPELIPIWQESNLARWMVTADSERNPDDPWSGWVEVDAEAHDQVVVINGVELTPDEARLYAQAILAAADHAEHFTTRRAQILFNLACPGNWPEINGLPVEEQRMIREAVLAASNRIIRENDSGGAR